MLASTITIGSLLPKPEVKRPATAEEFYALHKEAFDHAATAHINTSGFVIAEAFWKAYELNGMTVEFPEVLGELQKLKV